MALAAAAIAVAITLAIALSGEPEYKGKRLSQWLQIYGDNYNAEPFDGIEPRNAKLEAREAILQIGTKAIPWLTKWIGFENRPPIRDELSAIGWAPANRALGRVWRYVDRIGEKANYAALGFEILGERANGAVPALTRLLRSTSPTNQYPRPTIPRPAEALGWIGKEGLPALAEYVADARNGQDRAAVVSFLGHASDRLGTNANFLVPGLVNGLQGTDIYLATTCAVALRRLKVDPETVAPALGKTLNSNDRGLVMNVISALEEKGRKAESAVPALIELVNGPDGSIGKAAGAAVRVIAPERLEKRE
ncbi:MAG: hypothetical protein QOJ40_2303 [Verrucomicrobiota bacterium]